MMNYMVLKKLEKTALEDWSKEQNKSTKLLAVTIYVLVGLAKNLKIVVSKENLYK